MLVEYPRFITQNFHDFNAYFVVGYFMNSLNNHLRLASLGPRIGYRPNANAQPTPIISMRKYFHLGVALVDLIW